ncbi:hypothetical protein DOK_12036 [gamma proteobacterium BDW918]|nr:hypothetical protein DOK_12036 [gamma proteobacterium BDW918]
MKDDDSPPAPEVVQFFSEGIDCRAFVAFGIRGLNMRSCQITLMPEDRVRIKYIGDITRVFINKEISFDTDRHSAVAIQGLLNGPANQE